MTVWCVSYMNNDEWNPNIAVFSNKETAFELYGDYLGEYDRVDIEECVVNGV